MTLEERLLSRIMKRENGCWEWTGACNSGGYGQLCVLGHMRRVHRVAYELWNGPIPKGLYVLHRCNNIRCCNPAHLYAKSRHMIRRIRLSDIEPIEPIAKPPPDWRRF